MTEHAIRRSAGTRAGVILLASVLLCGLALAAAEDGPDEGLAAKIMRKKAVSVYTATDIISVRDPVVITGGLRAGAGPATVIPWSDIQKIDYRGRATLTGMWIGAGLFGALGTAWGIVWTVNEGEAVDPIGVLASTGAFAVIGAASGALIGALVPKWKTLYKVPAKPPLVARIAFAPARHRGMAMSLSLAF